VLLYNHKQEFIGIDDESLRLLNYSSLEDLLSVCTDVADLFANEPGYIHNFKNFGWIDFLLHADSDASSAIVHGNGRTFSCRLSVTPFYLCDQPKQNGYNIAITQVKSISGEDLKLNIEASKAASPELTQMESVAQSIPSAAPLPDYTHLIPTQLNEPSILDIPTKPSSTSFDDMDDLHASLMAPLSAKELDVLPEELPIKEEKPFVKPTPISAQAVPSPVPKSSQYSAAEKVYLSHHKVKDSYAYDPSVAANELGLPVDLIEEFIGDFIQQSHEFKNELFEAAAKNDINTLHILSHKLKGVAANLRIEDALETLTIINSSEEPHEIDANLKYYYVIISKLEGKEAPSSSNEEVLPIVKKETKPVIDLESMDDIYSFSLKQDKTYTEDESSLEKELLDLDDNAVKDTLDKEMLTANTEENEESILMPLHYDIVAVAGAMGIEPVFMKELLNDYKIDALAMSQTIIEAIKAFDTHTWKSSAAKLKGISDNLRLSDISDELAILSISNDAQEAKKSSERLVNYLAQI
jgi:HPt (histidine-containing phosphotransfer) domain-containing protein